MPVSKANNCVNCGALLNGPIKAGKTTCTFCGSVNLVSQDQKENENYCPNCHAANATESRHCSECGTLLVVNCPKCGTPNPIGVRFCGKCGEDIQKRPAIQELPIQPEAPEKTPSKTRIAPLQARHTSTMAVVSLVAGIASIMILPVIFSFVGIITGNLAKKEIRKGNGLVDGGGLATTGLVLSWITMILGLIALCIFIISLPSIINSSGSY